VTERAHHPSPGPPPNFVSGVFAPVAAGLAVCLAISGFLVTRRLEQRDLEAQFRRRADLHYGALQLNLQRNMESLEALRILFQVSSNVSRAEFRGWAKEIAAAHPELQVIEWAPRVARADRDAFEAAAKRDFLPEFEINDRDAANKPFRAGDRPEYFPLLYVEPFETNRLVAGFDAAAGKAARELQVARDTGEAAASGRIRLPQRDDVWGIIVTLPVYDSPSLPAGAVRHDHVRGVVRGVFRVEDLIAAAWRNVPAVGIDTMVLDLSAPPTNRFLYFHSSVLRDQPVAMPSEDEMRSGMHHELKTTVAGREWLFLFRPVPKWWTTPLMGYPWFLLVAGLLFSLLVYGYLRVLGRRTAVVERLVSERTASLEEANALLNREVAERRRTERRLIEAQRIGRIGSWEANLHDRTLTWSEEVFRIFGRDPESFRPTPDAFYEAIHRDDRARVREQSQHAQASGESYHIEHRIVRPNNTERVVVENAEVIHDETGRPVRMVGTVQDITERKQVEERLVLERNLLESVIEALPEMMFIKDSGGRYLRANSAVFRFLGARQPHDILGRTDAEILPDLTAAMFVTEDARVLETGEPMLNREAVVTLRNGERRTLLTSKVPFRDGDGRILGLVGIARDITDRKQAEDERATMERKFQATQKLESLGVLAGGIAHDFNNLLTGILGNASLARMDLPPQSPIQDYLEQIEVSSQRAADLCKQMLAYSGKGRFVIQPVEISALVEETLHLVQLSMSKKAVLKLELASGLPPVMADATQLRQIIMNLVINASDAIGEQSGVIFLRTSQMHADRKYLADLTGAEDLAEGDYVTLEVTDNGCGMSAETKARMFEPFFTTKFTGRGLGLAAVLGIVRGHKGALKVYSEQGRGSSFKLLLPATTARASAPRQSAAPAGPRASGNILLVDDEDTVRTVILRMLSGMGFDVLTASDGAKALEIYRAKSEEIAAVLLDLTMPHMDGEEAFREIRQVNPNAFVLLMSGFNEQDAVARFVGKGLAGFLQKPFTPEQLRAKLAVFFKAET